MSATKPLIGFDALLTMEDHPTLLPGAKDPNPLVAYIAAHGGRTPEDMHWEDVRRMGTARNATTGQLDVLNRAKRKLTDDDVLAIRVAYATGRVTQTELSARYRISRQVISRVVRLEVYADVRAAA